MPTKKRPEFKPKPRSRRELTADRQTKDWAGEGLPTEPTAPPRPVPSNPKLPCIVSSSKFRYYEGKGMYSALYKALVVDGFYLVPVQKDNAGLDIIGFIFKSEKTGKNIIMQKVYTRMGPTKQVLWIEYEPQDGSFLVVIYNL